MGVSLCVCVFMFKHIWCGGLNQELCSQRHRDPSLRPLFGQVMVILGDRGFLKILLEEGFQSLDSHFTSNSVSVLWVYGWRCHLHPPALMPTPTSHYASPYGSISQNNFSSFDSLHTNLLQEKQNNIVTYKK